MLKDFSTLLNRLAGMADEMGSYFRRMKEQKVLSEASDEMASVEEQDEK